MRVNPSDHQHEPHSHPGEVESIVQVPYFKNKESKGIINYLYFYARIWNIEIKKLPIMGVSRERYVSLLL